MEPAHYSVTFVGCRDHKQGQRVPFRRLLTEIYSGVTANYFFFLTREKEVINQRDSLRVGSRFENRLRAIPTGDGHAQPWFLTMRKSLSFFWFFFALATIAGASFLMAGLAAAQSIEFDPDQFVREDAAPLDPFVVYEWAASGSSCGLSPELLGAVGHAASAHGLIEGRTYDPDGAIKPALYGERGDGTIANLATLIDTDFGAIDDDDLWDRPVGPFQLLPVSWRLYGGDANRDGVEDPQNIWDASAAAANFLCAMGAGLDGDDVQAIRNYTGSDRLSQRVLREYDELLANSPVAKFVKGETSSKDGSAEGEPVQESGAALLGDWNGDGIPTSFVWETAGHSIMFMSPIAVAIPLDENGRPYGGQIRVEAGPDAQALVGDWDRDGLDSIAIRFALTDDTDVVEFYDRFGNAAEDVVTVGSDEGVNAIWDALGPEEQANTQVLGRSLTAANGQDLDLVTVGGILVNVEIAGAVEEMIEDAREDGVELSGWGWRSNERQIELRIQNCEDPWETPSSECSPPTARPGHSRHELGLAIDFHIEGRVITRLDPAFVWLEQHAGIYGLFNLPSEPWHWSVDGR